MDFTKHAIMKSVRFASSPEEEAPDPYVAATSRLSRRQIVFEQRVVREDEFEARLLDQAEEEECDYRRGALSLLSQSYGPCGNRYIRVCLPGATGHWLSVGDADRRLKPLVVSGPFRPVTHFWEDPLPKKQVLLAPVSKRHGTSFLAGWRPFWRSSAGQEVVPPSLKKAAIATVSPLEGTRVITRVSDLQVRDDYFEAPGVGIGKPAAKIRALVRGYVSPKAPVAGAQVAKEVQPSQATMKGVVSELELPSRDLTGRPTRNMGRRFASGDGTFRLRPRGRATRLLEAKLSGLVDRTSPRATVSEWLKATLPEGVKAVRILSEKVDAKASRDDDPEEETLHHVVFTLLGQEFRCCVELAAFVQSYLSLRERTTSVLASARARALVWCHDRDLDPLTVSAIVPPSLALAFRVRREEVAFNHLVGTRLAQFGFSAMQALAQGKPGLGRMSGWDQFRHLTQFKWLLGDPMDDRFVSSFSSA